MSYEELFVSPNASDKSYVKWILDRATADILGGSLKDLLAFLVMRTREQQHFEQLGQGTTLAADFFYTGTKTLRQFKR